MARLRTFIAIGLSKSVTRRLDDLQESLRAESSGVKWTPLENFHLTLHFLGEVNTLDLVSICRVVRDRSRRHEPFSFEVAGVGGFPNMRRPKILWAGINNGADELKDLHDDIEESLCDLGCYRREDRPYNPHLTLGRLNHDDNAEQWGEILSKYADWHGGISPVEEVLIMSSELRREGPNYSVVGRAPLNSEFRGDNN